MGKHLLVCSGGGHLKQLFTLANRIGLPEDDQLMVSFETGLSRQLLAGRDVSSPDTQHPRDALNILRNARLARDILRRERFETAISTGSSIAVNFLPLAAPDGGRRPLHRKRRPGGRAVAHRDGFWPWTTGKTLIASTRHGPGPLAVRGSIFDRVTTPAPPLHGRSAGQYHRRHDRVVRIPQTLRVRCAAAGRLRGALQDGTTVRQRPGDPGPPAPWTTMRCSRRWPRRMLSWHTRGPAPH